MSSIYINLAVRDVSAATAFYTHIGFVQNAAFSNESASAMVYDENLSVMLLSHTFCQNYLPVGRQIADTHATSSGMYALSLPGRTEVDSIYEKAISAGAKKTIDMYDHGWMYGRDFEDLDGHIWEIFTMDVAAMPAYE